jgi:hypothetical protein
MASAEKKLADRWRVHRWRHTAGTTDCFIYSLSSLVHPTLNRSILEAAPVGMKEQRKRLDEHIASIRSLLGSRGTARSFLAGAAVGAAPQPRNRRRVSAAARKRMAAAVRKRWAAVKGR